MAKEHSTRGVESMTDLDAPMTATEVIERRKEAMAEQPKRLELAPPDGDNDLLYRLLVEHDSATRKMAPLYRGCIAYFRDALMAVALHSYLANDKHNPGEELHWSIEKSADHKDCVARHLADAECGRDENGMPHSVAKAWRALADLQVELMKEYGLPDPPAVRRAK